MAKRKQWSPNKARRKNRKGKLANELNEREHKIVYLTAAKFPDQYDEDRRASLLKAYIQGSLTLAQWNLISVICDRHKRAKRVGIKGYSNR